MSERFFRCLKNVADLLLIHIDYFLREARVTFNLAFSKEIVKKNLLLRHHLNMKTKTKKFGKI